MHASGDEYEVFKTFNITAIACSDSSLSEMHHWNAIAREHGVKMVGCDVKGGFGLIFSDFLDSYMYRPSDKSEEKSMVARHFATLTIAISLFHCCRRACSG